MCTLMEHSERSFREKQAEAETPIYAQLTKEREAEYGR